MKVLVKWATATAGGWQEIDSRQWGGLPAKPVPAGGEVIDDAPGWVVALNVQGVEFTGYDHYAIEDPDDGSDGIRVTVWNDDPADQDLDLVRLIRPDQEPFPLGFYGQVWTFLPLAPDSAMGGAWNTRQTMVYYAEADKEVWDSLGDLPKRPWLDLPIPPLTVTKHGIWLAPDHMAQHMTARTLHGWREWTEGVPADQIVDGRLHEQRAQGLYKIPDGTRTFYWRDTDLDHPVLTGGHEDELSTTAGGAGVSESASVAAGGSTIFVATTVSGEPNSADWPNGTYRCQMDCTAAGANITYGLNGTDGDFRRESSDLNTNLEQWPQAEANFTGTGLKLATASRNPAAGDAGDRFCVWVMARNTATMNAAQTFTLRVNTSDAFTDGPWTEAGGGAVPKRLLTLGIGLWAVLSPAWWRWRRMCEIADRLRGVGGERR